MAIPQAALLSRVHDLQITLSEGNGVRLTHRVNLAIATVLIRNHKQVALAQRLRERFGAELPIGPVRVTAGKLSFAGTGPGAYFAILEGGGHDFAATMNSEFAGLVSVADQSDAYAVLQLSGSKVRDLLSKLVPIDVHPRAFGISRVAVTVAAYAPLTLWRLEDDSKGCGVFELAVARSFAASFGHALSESASEYGLSITQS